ncbi:MAG: peptidoglycan DD-metalloendopeptidase family protein [Cytophagaceae bacterium]|nr:peptidoglycan DD-metalloendopeptidase family protein [Cytophagaceae bacterium]MDW8456343.1 peptidoglycan DD-metalloendopeptidase family protein [Cytophagaceae bacterium]
MFTTLFVCLCGLPYAQKKSRAVLEKEKADNQRRIEEANKILAQTKQKKQSTLGQLAVLNSKIQSRKKLISSIQEEISLLQTEISDIETNINTKEKEIHQLKEEYKKMLFVAYKHNRRINKLIYIFSSESIMQMAMRIKYFQHYSKARQQKLLAIQNHIKDLDREKNKRQKKLDEKNKLIGIKAAETEQLKTEHKEQEIVLKALSKKEAQLRKELNERKKAIKKLENLITTMIAAEREKALRSAGKKSMNKSSDTDNATASVKENNYTPMLTPEAKNLSASFSENEGKLPWPVVYGSIAQHFGKQPHPVLKGVYIDNLGIDIQTKKDEDVRAVFQGNVVTVAEVPGMNKVVMIQHGEYFTVYAKLKNVIVSTGDVVTAKQKIGTVYTDKDEQSQLQFQIWKNNSRLNPENWLYCK